ncbi:MAG: phosphoribosylglycinamide formyltransferase [Deltaproteobacteria bacterium]|nr:phosphoribosylglycinamide formyltransferase [Deltaproteobacteria bacterium]
MRLPLRLGVLVSGNGTNLQAILDAIERKKLSAEIALVISNRPEAHALQRARDKKIPIAVVTAQEYPSRESFDGKMSEQLDGKKVGLVILAGFMRILTPTFVRHYQGRLMNIHPSLLPSFPGLHAVQQALDHGVKQTGCTVHFVDEGTDTGPVILQQAVPVLDNDTEATLTERIHREEHKLYPKAIELFAQGKIRLTNRRVLISGGVL